MEKELSKSLRDVEREISSEDEELLYESIPRNYSKHYEADVIPIHDTILTKEKNSWPKTFSNTKFTNRNYPGPVPVTGRLWPEQTNEEEPSRINWIPPGSEKKLWPYVSLSAQTIQHVSKEDKKSKNIYEEKYEKEREEKSERFLKRK